MTESARRDDADVAGRLHSVAIHLLRRVRQTDPEMGLTAAPASALSVLVFGGPRPMGELAAIEQVAAPTMTRLVAGLEAAGLVTRRVDRSDRRSMIVAATARGRRTLERGRQRRVAQIESVLQGLSDADRRAIADAVIALERVLGRTPRPPSK